MAETTLLEVEHLRTWFPVREGVFKRVTGHVRAVDDVSFSVGRGETFALVGESGCGKSTVARSILRLTEARAGKVRYDGRELLEMDEKQFRPLRRDLQIVLQDPASALDPRMTVRDSIAEGLDIFGLAGDAAERDRKVAELMQQVSLNPEHMLRYPHEFSGGQRQRICIARALAVGPKLIICDEPVSALDVSIQAQILNLLNRLKGEHGLSYLFITHDLGVVRHFADQVAVMYLGRIVEQGPTAEIFASPKHPYTEALLASVPSLDPECRGGLVPALGETPSPAAPPAGCHYHPRCVKVLDRCAVEDPPIVRSKKGISRCWLAAEESAGK